VGGETSNLVLSLMSKGIKQDFKTLIGILPPPEIQDTY
jgi:hypothetical protein